MTSATANRAAASSGDAPRQRPRRRRAFRDWRVKGWFFLLPLIAVNAFVVFVPSLSAVYYSFTDWSGIGDAEFIGLENYQRLVADPEFQNGLIHNLLWTVFFLTVPMSLGLYGAYALSRIRRFRLLFRVLYFIPYIVASVVNASIWQSILAPTGGVGELFGINPLGNPSWALLSVAFVNNWAWWGFLLVVFLAAMQGINPSLYEAAALDGAGPWRQFFSITLPSIRPTFAFLGLMTIIWSFLAFDYVYIMTQGGPAGSTDLLSTVLYRRAFEDLEAGYASAIGVVMALISGIVVGVYLTIRHARKWDI